MSAPNERDQAVFRQVWPSWLGVPNDWGARRVAEYREHCVKAERERVLAAVLHQLSPHWAKYSDDTVIGLTVADIKRELNVVRRGEP
jgi:hypothetical protein